MLVWHSKIPRIVTGCRKSDDVAIPLFVKKKFANYRMMHVLTLLLLVYTFTRTVLVLSSATLLVIGIYWIQRSSKGCLSDRDFLWSEFGCRFGECDGEDSIVHASFDFIVL